MCSRNNLGKMILTWGASRPFKNWLKRLHLLLLGKWERSRALSAAPRWPLPEPSVSHRLIWQLCVQSLGRSAVRQVNRRIYSCCQPTTRVCNLESVGLWSGGGGGGRRVLSNKFLESIVKFCVLKRVHILEKVLNEVQEWKNLNKICFVP